MLNQKEIDENKKIIIKLLESTKREGIDKVISFLEKSNYFNMAGSRRHHKYAGGLAEHSLNVCELALSKNMSCDISSIIISSLLHDLCKISSYYTKGISSKGHGSRSVNIIEKIINFKLTNEERRAIRFHMSKRNRNFYKKDNEEYEIAKNEELRNIIHISDEIDAATSFISGFFL